MQALAMFLLKVIFEESHRAEREGKGLVSTQELIRLLAEAMRMRKTEGEGWLGPTCHAEVALREP
jgi:hypothetical protein